MLSYMFTVHTWEVCAVHTHTRAPSVARGRLGRRRQETPTPYLHVHSTCSPHVILPSPPVLLDRKRDRVSNAIHERLNKCRPQHFVMCLSSYTVAHEEKSPANHISCLMFGEEKLQLSLHDMIYIDLYKEVPKVHQNSDRSSISGASGH